MITEKDIHALSELARLELTPKEEKELTADIEAILGYVGDITNVSIPGTLPKDHTRPVNVLREDTDPYVADMFTEDLLNEVDERDGRSVVVKKILS